VAASENASTLNAASSESVASESPKVHNAGLNFASSEASLDTCKQGLAQQSVGDARVKCKRNAALSTERDANVDKFRSLAGKTSYVSISSSNVNAFANHGPALDACNDDSNDASNLAAAISEVPNNVMPTNVGTLRRKWKRHVNEVLPKPAGRHEDQIDQDLPVESNFPEKQADTISNASATKWRPSLRLQG
jgi:hypothetical protein